MANRRGKELLLILTIGSKHGRANVIVNEAITTGWKFNIFGYISKGDRVPDVIITVWNLSNTGLMAIEESKQLKIKNNYNCIRLKVGIYLKCKMGFDTVGVLSSKGSTIIVKPFVYVDTKVAK